MRRLVLSSGAVLGIAGCLLVASFPTGWAWRAVASLAWCASVARELWLVHRAWQGCRKLRFSADGEVAILGAGGEWRPARLVSGGVLLSRLGWLRLQAAGGPVFAEFVRGERRRDRDWRRLHVIWRHFGAAG
ncbi:MAG: hypothetical protein MJA32_12860 [Proteobacteria bacterium]|nr:hypothetical protein [Pseudomonadota bacterium]